MDLQTALLCGAVFVLTTGILLLISLFGIKSKSYEEALAEQRDLKAGLLGIKTQARLKHAKEKKLKKLNRKNKEKSITTSSSEGTSGDETTASSSANELTQTVDEVNTKSIPVINIKHNTHVDFVVDEPEVIPPEPQVKIGRKKQRDLKPINVRPILVNRDPSPVSSFTPVDSPKTLNHFEKIHPKDEKELLKSQIIEKLNQSPKNKKTKNKNKPKDVSKPETIQSDVVVTENVHNGKKSKNLIENSASPNVKKQSKAKKEIQQEKVKELVADKLKKENVPEKNKKETEKTKLEYVEKNEKQKNNSQTKNSVSSKNDSEKTKITEKKQEKVKNIQIKKENVSKNNQELNKKEQIEQKNQVIEKNKKEQQNADNKKSQASKNQINVKKVNNIDNKKESNIEKNLKKDSMEKLKNDSNQKTKIEIVDKSNQDTVENGKKDSVPTKKYKKDNLPEKKIENNAVVVQKKTDNNTLIVHDKKILEKIKSEPEMYNDCNGIHVQNSNSVTSNGISAKESKKRKRELNALQQMSGDNTGVNVSLLVPLVRKAELSRSEVQILIDLLLNKQHDMPIGHQEWFEGRSDPVVKLRKQLAERERALQAEQEAHVGVAAKLREVRGELNSCMQAKRQIEESNVQAFNERQQLIARLHQKQEHLQAENQLLQNKIQQLNAKLNEDRLVSRQLQDDNAKLQKQQALELAVRLTEQHKDNDLALKNKIGTLHSDLQEQLNVANALRREVHSARSEADVLRDRNSHLQSAADQAQELARQLEESRHTVAELESRLTMSMNNAQSMSDQLNKYEDDKLKSHSEIQCLQSQLERAHTISQQQQEEHERIVGQIKSELNTLKVNANGSAEEDKVRQVEILNLHNELDSARAELKALKDELDKQRQKNNDIRQLNWKVMEALNAAEKINENSQKVLNENITRVHLAEQEIQQKFLKRLFPDISITATTHEQFLNDFEKSVNVYIEKSNADVQNKMDKEMKRMKDDFEEQLQKKDNEFHKQLRSIENKYQEDLNECRLNNTQLADANEEISRLQKTIVRYKTIIDNTQLTLNKLEMSVAKEEQNWRAELCLKDEEICQLKTKFSQTHSKQILELKEKLLAEEKRNKELISQCETLRVRACGTYKNLDDKSNRLDNCEPIRIEDSPNSNNSFGEVKLKVTNNSNGPTTADSSLSEYQSSTSPSPAPSHNSNNSLRSSKCKKKKAKK